ncbi:MAG: hypothetical protein AAFY28_22070, partial [Actinomycetota bacterium]
MADPKGSAISLFMHRSISDRWLDARGESGETSMRVRAYAAGMTALGVAICAGAAHGAFSISIDPSTLVGGGFANQIDTLDQGGINNGYSYPTSSGHASFIPPGSGGLEIAETGLESNVYRITQATSIPSSEGAYAVNPGDLIFEYKLSVIGAFADTIRTMTEVPKAGIPPTCTS